MDTFTDVDIFKEVVDASIRGVPVYILLDELNLKSFLSMAENQDVKLQQLRVGSGPGARGGSLFDFFSIVVILFLKDNKITAFAKPLFESKDKSPQC